MPKIFFSYKSYLIVNSGKEIGRCQGDPAIKDRQAGGQVAWKRNRNSKIVKGRGSFFRRPFGCVGAQKARCRYISVLVFGAWPANPAEAYSLNLFQKTC